MTNTKATVDDLILIGWNVHVGAKPKVVRKALRREIRKAKKRWGRKPDLIALSEASSLFDELPAIAHKLGYDVDQEKPGDRSKNPVSEHGDVATLLLDSRREVRRRGLNMKLPWYVYTAKRWHHPRRYRLRVFRSKAGTRVKVLGDHWPTNGLDGGNGVASRESADRVEKIARNTPDEVPVIAIGDKNDSAKNLRARFPDAIVAGVHPDFVVAFGVVSVQVVERPSYGSDHPLVAYRVVLSS